MNYLYLLDWTGLTIGIIGTILWAHNGKYAKYAAVFWFTSSLLWIAFAYLSELTALGIRDAINLILYLYGGWRWFSSRETTESTK